MHLRNLQALRAVAALLVVAVHVYTAEARFLLGPPWLSFVHLSGSYGVDLFFVISGTVMVVTSWDAFGRPGAPAVFLARRATRILLPYWCVTLLVAAAMLLVPQSTLRSSTHPDLAASLLLLPQAGEPVLVVGWTLTYEALFYLLFAAALRFRPLVARWLPAVWLAGVLAVAACGLSANPYARVAGSPFNLEFMLGLFVGAAAKRGRLFAPRRVVTAALTAWLIIFIVTARLHGDVLSPTWLRPLTVGVAAALLVYAAIGLERRRGAIAPAALQTLGSASYALYLWHVPAIGLLAFALHRIHLQGAGAHAVLITGSFALAVGAALAAYRWIERPLLRAFTPRPLQVTAP